jgi:hypothetical protein
MSDKKPYLLERDRGGSGKLNNPDDGTSIQEMFTLGDDLLILTGKCTYRLNVADQVDPERLNPGLPHNFQQKLFDYGVESELLCRTLLQAKVLLRSEFQKVDTSKAMQLAFEALTNIISMNDMGRAFEAAQASALKRVAAPQKGDRSMTVPAVGNVRDQCKTFIQKADHFSKALLHLLRLFYPGAKNWDVLAAHISSEFGADDPFTKVSELVTPMLQMIRDTRDALEHNPDHVTVRDFEPAPNGNVWPPSLEVRHRKTKVERCSLSEFMAGVVQDVCIAFEMMTVHACGKAVQPISGFPISVGSVPPEHRAKQHVRFAYGIFYEDGNFVPFG